MERGRQIAVTALVATVSTVAFWKSLEGDGHLMPFQDIAGVWTVCGGITGPDVIPGVPWTQEKCDRRTWEVVNKFGEVVVLCTGNAPLTRGQRDALIAFAGNVGETAFCESRLAEAIQNGERVVDHEFRRWVFVSCRSIGGCRFSEGLFNRRTKEIARWNVPGEPAIYRRPA